MVADETPERSAVITENIKVSSLAIEAAEAFQQFCNPKVESLVKPLEKHGIRAEVFLLWRRVYETCKPTSKFNSRISETVKKGFAGLTGNYLSFNTWEFMVKQIPWICESLSSVTDAPKVYYFAVDKDLFNTMRTMKGARLQHGHHAWRQNR